MDEETLRHKLEDLRAKRKDENGRLVGFGLFMAVCVLAVVLGITLGKKTAARIIPLHLGRSQRPLTVEQTPRAGTSAFC
jgi:hypothetical protein